MIVELVDIVSKRCSRFGVSGVQEQVWSFSQFHRPAELPVAWVLQSISPTGRSSSVQLIPT